MGDVVGIVDWLCKKAADGDKVALERVKSFSKFYYVVATRQSAEIESAAAFCDACRENANRDAAAEHRPLGGSDPALAPPRRRGFMNRILGLP